MRSPISPRGTSRPSSTISFNSNPSTPLPRVSQRGLAGSFERKRAKASVVPIDSTISKPVFSFQLCQSDAGKDSPAATHMRKEERSYFLLKPSTANMLAYPVGTLKRNVGLKRSIVSKILVATLGGCACNTVLAPTCQGENRFEPSFFFNDTATTEK